MSSITEDPAEILRRAEAVLASAQQTHQAFMRVRHSQNVLIGDLRREVAGLTSLSDRLRRFAVACCAGSVITVSKLAELLNLPVADALDLVNQHIHAHGIPDFSMEVADALDLVNQHIHALGSRKDGEA